MPEYNVSIEVVQMNFVRRNVREGQREREDQKHCL